MATFRRPLLQSAEFFGRRATLILEGLLGSSGGGGRYSGGSCPEGGLSFLELGKTKTLQTVTLRVSILSDFSARRLSQNFGAKLKQKSAQVRAVSSWKFAGTELSLAVLPFAVF